MNFFTNNFKKLFIFYFALFSIQLCFADKFVERADIPILQQVTQHFFSNCKEYNEKISHPIANKFQDLEDVQHCISYETFINTYNQYKEIIQNSPFMAADKWLDQQPPSPELFDESIPLKNAHGNYKNFIYPYVQKLILPPNSKPIICGDIHGSFHSLLRNLWRHVIMGNLNKNLVIINPNAYFVFLGDYVDRGRYSIEVIWLLMKLKIANPGKVILMRGNHEDLNMAAACTLEDEINVKFPGKRAYVYTKLRFFYESLPLVIYVGCGTNFMQWCHAGIDPSYNPTNLLTNTDPNITYECLLNKTHSPLQPSQYFSIETIEQMRTHFAKLGINIDNFFGVGYLWGDFGRKINSFDNSISSSTQLCFSGHGLNASIELTDAYLKDLNAKLARRCTELGINPVKVNAIGHGHFHTDYGLTMHNGTKDVNGDWIIDPNESENGYHWTSLVQTEDLLTEDGFAMHKYFPLFNLISAPEGLGKNDNAHGTIVNFNYDSFCEITTDLAWEEWKIKPYEFELPRFAMSGSYCQITKFINPSICQAILIDPLRFNFVQMPPKSSLPPQSLSEDIIDIAQATQDADETIEQLKLQKSINTQIASDQAGIICQDFNILSPYPYEPPSIAHLCLTQKLNSPSEITDSLIQRLLQHHEDCLKYRDYYPIIPTEQLEHLTQQCRIAFEQEYKHQQTHAVFYHATSNARGIIFHVIKKIHELGLLTDQQPFAFRLDGPSLNSLNAPNIQEFLDQINSIERGPDHCFHYKGESRYWFDHLPVFLDQLLSVNFALFANQNLYSDNSKYYWIAGAASKHIDARNILTEIFQKCDFNTIFIDKIIALYNKYILNNQTTRGVLFQIFVNKKIVDEVGYMALPGGKPMYQEIIPQAYDNTMHNLMPRNRHTTITPFLDRYVQDPQGLDHLCAQKEYIGINHNYQLSLNLLQARLWLPALLNYDNKDIIINSYYAQKVSDENNQQFEKELDTIFHLILKDFLIRQNLELTQTYNPFAQKLSPLLEITKKRAREGNDQEEARTKVRLEQALRSNDYRTLQIIGQNSILPTPKLSGNQTPLIVAVKSNNMDLVQMIINHTNKWDLELEHIDFTGRTALDWALERGNPRIINMLCKCSITPNMLTSNHVAQFFARPTPKLHDSFPWLYLEIIRKAAQTKNPALLNAFKSALGNTTIDITTNTQHQLVFHLAWPQLNTMDIVCDQYYNSVITDMLHEELYLKSDSVFFNNQLKKEFAQKLIDLKILNTLFAINQNEMSAHFKLRICDHLARAGGKTSDIDLSLIVNVMEQFSYTEDCITFYQLLVQIAPNITICCDFESLDRLSALPKEKITIFPFIIPNLHEMIKCVTKTSVIKQLDLLKKFQHLLPPQKTIFAILSEALYNTANLTNPTELLERELNQLTIEDRVAFAYFSICGQTSLFGAATNGFLPILQILVNAVLQKNPNAIINPVIPDGATSLHAAAQNGDLAIVQFLVETLQRQNPEADINPTRASDRVTPLYIAAQDGHLDIVQFLVETLQRKNSAANINPALSNETTALHIASANGHLPVVQFLVETLQQQNPEADINPTRASDRVTPLYIAAQDGKLAIVQFLVETLQRKDPAADINPNSRWGTPLHAAERNHHHDIVNYLKGKLHQGS
ncbi:MAG: ankyrin repeat domain-containing protein [Candidatus Babeliales bacterium]